MTAPRRRWSHHEHFRKLWNDLPRTRDEVQSLTSANPEDDRMVKFAIVGHSYSRPVDSWGRNELEFVSDRRQEVADFGPRWVAFVCLATGYLLGMHQAGHFSDADCLMFEAELPGFMWLHSERFTDDDSPPTQADRP